MDLETASFIVRQHIALVDEGIGPATETPDIDREILQSAARMALAYNVISVHTAWDVMLITDEQHVKFCKCQ